MAAVKVTSEFVSGKATGIWKNEKDMKEQVY